MSLFKVRVKRECYASTGFMTSTETVLDVYQVRYLNGHTSFLGFFKDFNKWSWFDMNDCVPLDPSEMAKDNFDRELDTLLKENSK